MGSASFLSNRRSYQKSKDMQDLATELKTSRISLPMISRYLGQATENMNENRHMGCCGGYSPTFGVHDKLDE